MLASGRWGLLAVRLKRTRWTESPERSIGDRTKRDVVLQFALRVLAAIDSTGRDRQVTHRRSLLVDREMADAIAHRIGQWSDRVREDRIVWWISYRGESGYGLNNIGVFEDDGIPRKTHPLLLDPSPAAEPLHIARGFALVRSDLYIASAWRKNSHIARYHREGDSFRFAQVLAKTEQVAAMVHPFDVDLGDDGRVYISCQDTNTVVSLVPQTREPAPVAKLLRKRYPDGKFLPGTFVASSHGGLPEYGDRTPLDVPLPLGLSVVLDERGGPRRSVRGIVVHRKHLYVADEAADAVKIFDVQSGELMAHISQRTLKAPVHLLLHGETLYIGASGTGSVLALDLMSTPPSGKLKARVVIDGKLDAPSGIAVGPDGDLYVAEWKKRRVRRFSPKGKKRGTFIDDLPDMPEFLVYIR